MQWCCGCWALCAYTAGAGCNECCGCWVLCLCSGLGAHPVLNVVSCQAYHHHKEGVTWKPLCTGHGSNCASNIFMNEKQQPGVAERLCCQLMELGPCIATKQTPCYFTPIYGSHNPILHQAHIWLPLFYTYIPLYNYGGVAADKNMTNKAKRTGCRPQQ